MVAQLAQEMYSNDMLHLLVANMWRMEFEVGMDVLQVLTRHRLIDVVFPDSFTQARKDVAQVFNSLLRRQIGQRLPTVEYLSSKPDVIFSALKGCVP